MTSLLEVPLSSLRAVWDELDDHGKDLRAAAALCLIDRYYLLVKVLGRVDCWHPWVYARCREVEKDTDGHIDIWGRDHFKSSIITTAGSIQEILKNPEITIAIFSHSRPISKAFLAQIKRELEGNPYLKSLFPAVLYQDPAKESPSWSLDAGIVVRRQGNPKEATLEAHGLIDGMPTSRHFMLRVYDDVVVQDSVNTPEQIQKTTQAWELSDNLGVANGRMWVVGTRYSFADTYQEIINRGSAILRHRPATHDGTISGKPVLLTPEQWAAKIRDQGEATVACQLLGNPLAGHQRLFDVEDLQVYEIRPETLMAYLMVDPAHSMKKGSDHTAMAVIGIDYSGNKYLLDGYDHRMDLMERWRRMCDLWSKWKGASGVQGVKVGYERTGAISDLDYFEERQRIEGVSLDIQSLEWPRQGPGSKSDRVQRLGPDLRSHRFYVPYSTDSKNLTTLQRKAYAGGYEYRVARPIRRRDENDQIYDLTERFRLQVGFFPFCERVDLIDAVSRLYDLEPSPPYSMSSYGSLEPDEAW